MNAGPEFLVKAAVLHMHRRAIVRFGGSFGLRDEGRLESALMSAENRYFYEGASLAQCAAAYAYHLCQAHAFVDGNKRVAALAAEASLRLNGATLTATDDELIVIFLSIASGELDRAAVDKFFQGRVHLG